MKKSPPHFSGTIPKNFIAGLASVQGREGKPREISLSNLPSQASLSGMGGFTGGGRTTSLVSESVSAGYNGRLGDDVSLFSSALPTRRWLSSNIFRGETMSSR